MMRTRIAAAAIVLAAILTGGAAPASAATVPCPITNPGYNGSAGCARMTWNEATGQLCWYHAIKSTGYRWVATEMKLTGQTQWRTTFEDFRVDANWVGGCTPRRGQTGAVPRPTNARAQVMQHDGRELKIPFEIVLVG